MKQSLLCVLPYRERQAGVPEDAQVILWRGLVAPVELRPTATDHLLQHTTPAGSCQPLFHGRGCPTGA